jgi:heterotetrameric sarcosine oxidase gamma subunit
MPSPRVPRPPIFKPVARSPLHQCLAEEGAVFSNRSGWLVADHFGNAREEAESARSALGLADLSFTAKWDIQGAEVEQALRRVLDASMVPEPGRAAAYEGCFVCRLARDHALLILDRPEAVLLTRFREQAANGCLHFTDRTSGYGRLVLWGAQARGVLCKLAPLDVRESTFPNLSCAWTPMAGVRVLLFRRDRRDLLGYEILVSRECAEYLWNSLLKAGQEYEIRRHGLEALRLLEGS